VANRIIFGWHPSGFFVGEIPWQDWRRMDEFQRVCWHWRYKNSFLENVFKDHANYNRVRFEDLFSEKGAETLQALFSFMGIAFDPRFSTMLQKKKNFSSKKWFPPWDQWDTEKKEHLLEICGKEMKRYGYL